ncbi:MAG: DUF4105 domain-containing protein [Helicobacteraceae bacterium]|nr:DUF4105 domain-containing protein [Helicobacteraceae bacterium]
MTSAGLLSDKGLLKWKAALHYKGEASVIGAKSPFFLSAKGHSDPIAELNAAIDALKSDPNAQCKYPARLDLLLKQGAIELNDLPSATCDDYQTYLRKVPFDRVYIVFVAEDHSAAESQMGHTILKIAGEDDQNITREHSFSFMALMRENGNFTRYISAVFDGTEGSYVLAPYAKTIETYIYGANRSLWEFEIILSDEAKERLRKHLWELKETPILYQFITHNCNTAIEAILNAADGRYADDKHWLFATPVEYLQLLEERDLIGDISVRPSAIDKVYFAQNRSFYPLNAPSASRVSVHIFDGGFTIEAMPNYRDMRSVANASAIEVENKLIEIAALYENDKAYLERLDLIAMKTIADFTNAGSSKLFRLGVETSGRDRLSPFAEWGRGAGIAPFEGVLLYAMPRVGFAQGKRANLYAAIETGAIARVGTRSKILINYTRFFDVNKDYRGFEGELNAHIVFAPTKDYDISVAYRSRFDRDDRFEPFDRGDRNGRDRLSIGASVYF